VVGAAVLNPDGATRNGWPGALVRVSLLVGALSQRYLYRMMSRATLRCSARRPRTLINP